MNRSIAYKLVDPKKWHKFSMSGNQKCYGFEKDIIRGHIGLCTKEQIPGVLKKFELASLRSNDQSKVPYVVKVYVHLDNTQQDSQFFTWSLRHSQLYPRLYGYMSFDKNIIDVQTELLFQDR
jgi:uncharacterized protein (DUF952 family)